MKMRMLAAWATAFAAAMCGQPASAAPEEVQVYMDELNPRATPGLDVHINDVASGTAGADYPGGEASLHRWRITPEFSYGLGDGFEAGLYLPMATIAGDGVFRVDGVKARVKWLAPHGEEGFYWGLNYEVGKSAYRLDQNGWNNEIKLIGGWRNNRWLVAVNGNVDFALSGPAPGPATLEIATKAGYKLSPRTTLGIESYNEVGPLRDPLLAFNHLGQSEHSTYLVADTNFHGWDLNAGLGKGYGGNGDSIIVKFIVGVPIGRHSGGQ